MDKEHKTKNTTDDAIRQILLFDFYTHRNEIVFLIEVICQYSTKCKNQKHFIGIDMKKLSVWGGVGKNTSDNPYIKELMRDLVSKLYEKMVAMENYYNQIVYDNKLNGMIVLEEDVESFQEIFNKNYPFDLSFDDLVFDFAKLKESVIRSLSKMK